MADIANGTYFPKIQTDALTVGGGSLVKVSAHTLTAAADGKLKLDGAGAGAATVGWANPEAGTIAITELLVYNPAGTSGTTDINIGTTTVSAATASDNIIDGLDCKTATAIVLASLVANKGTNGVGKPISLAAGKWVTFTDNGTGDVTGLATNVDIFYVVL